MTFVMPSESMNPFITEDFRPFLSPFGIAATVAPAPRMTTCGRFFMRRSYSLDFSGLMVMPVSILGCTGVKQRYWSDGPLPEQVDQKLARTEDEWGSGHLARATPARLRPWRLTAITWCGTTSASRSGPNSVHASWH